jgi:hypothetical protein
MYRSFFLRTSKNSTEVQPWREGWVQGAGVGGGAREAGARGWREGARAGQEPSVVVCLCCPAFFLPSFLAYFLPFPACACLPARTFMSATSLMMLRSFLVSSLWSFLECGSSATRSSMRWRYLRGQGGWE